MSPSIPDSISESLHFNLMEGAEPVTRSHSEQEERRDDVHHMNPRGDACESPTTTANVIAEAGNFTDETEAVGLPSPSQCYIHCLSLHKTSLDSSEK
jgi:hypothetical protein